MYFTFCIIACIVNAIVTIVAFFLYVRTRLNPREQPRLESLFQTIHFITLALFVLFGVLALVHLSDKLNRGPIL